MPVTDDPENPELRIIDPENNMQMSYLVLSQEERAKGYVRPLYRAYVHVGPGMPDNLRDLTPEEHERYDHLGYYKYQEYPEGSHALGKFWTEAALERAQGGCGGTTAIGLAIAETYARQPDYYGGTYCARCQSHYPVGEDGEFVWAETDVRVGT